ncbi:MAG: ABC transporter substrate-binding protein [Candidatus Velthaea sp.]
MRLFRTVTALVAFAGLTLTQAGAAPSGPSGSPIIIGAVLSITGNYAPLGEPERNALKVAEADINARGGIAGRPVQFKIVDDEGKADTAQQLVTQLVGEKVAAIIGGTLTPTTIAMTRVTNEAKIIQLYMNPTDSVWNTKNGVMKYLYESTPRNELEGTKLLRYNKTKLKGKAVALLHDEAPYGVTGAQVLHGVAQKEGVDIVADEAFPITATDLTPQLQKVLAAKADTILIWTASPAAAILVRQAKQLGFKGNILGTTGIVSDNFLRVSGKDGYGVYSDMNLNVTHPDKQQRAFIDSYRKTYNVRPSNFASFAWDAAHLLAMAITATKGDTSGDALAHALDTMRPYSGTTGVYQFTATDHNGLGPAAVKMAREEGAWVIIE